MQQGVTPSVVSPFPYPIPGEILAPMVKTVRLEPIAQETAIETNSNLLSVLLNKELDVLKECGGRGMCATCHIYVQSGMEALTPINRREQRTLEVITSCKPNSPVGLSVAGDWQRGGGGTAPGMYVNSLQDIEALVGRRAEQDLLHPITGEVLVETGKLITRSVLKQLEDTASFKVGEFFTQSTDF